MAIYYRHLDDLIVVSGKTYPYRDLIKGFGGRFESTNKVWHIPHNDAALKAIDELCRSVGGGPLKTPATAAKTSPIPARQSAPAIAVRASADAEASASKAAINPQLGMTVRELMQQAQLAIQAAFPRSVWIIGEIQNLNMRKSGVYFQLADFKEGGSQSATMTVNSTIWANQARAIAQKLGSEVLKGLLQDGMKVRLLVQVSIYRDRGQLSLSILDIDPRFTKGALALAREELLRELRQKGLDRLNAQRFLPAFPFRIGLISAEDSRAKSDFLHQLLSYGFPGEVIFYPTQMQGEKTLTEVCEAIEKLAKAECDVIVLTRGGGSLADLRWFDSREIAMAIIQCQVPVIAAIGHQDDVCIAEEVAYRREKTPTAAADFILSTFQKSKERLESSAQLMARRLQESLQLQFNLLNQLKDQLRHSSHQQLNLLGERLNRQIFQLQNSLNQQQHRLGQQLLSMSHEIKRISQQRLAALKEHNLSLLHRFTQAYQQGLYRTALVAGRLEQKLYLTVKDQLARIDSKLVPLEKSLAQSDPRPWLNRGWTHLESSHGQTIRSVEQVSPGQTLKARLQDGLIYLSVTDIKTSKKGSDHHE